ncbi:podocalyxin isoform X2 [Chanodichthys erythropterus]|uniref:podocalyxin isoform X2 n=1 Tax=Chanodichthys erythropterus TaxID=933992 RepID=UPI00351E6698
MAITWTIIVLGALLHDASTQNNTSTSLDTTNSTSVDTTNSTSVDTTNSTSVDTIKPTSVDTTSPTSSNPIIPTTKNLETSTKLNPTTVNPTTPTKQSITAPIPTQNLTASNTTPTKLSPTTLKHPTSSLSPHSTPLASLATKEPTQQPSRSDSPQVTTQITTIQPTTTTASPTDSKVQQSYSTKSSTTFSQDTTSSNEPATTTNKRSGTSPNNQADPSAGTTNSPASTVSQGFTKLETQTTSAPITSTTLPVTTRPVNADNKIPTSENFTHDVFDLSHSSKGNVVHETCKQLGQNLKGNCSVTVEIQGNKLIGTFTINADQMIPTESYKPQKEDVITDKELIPDTLIAILASCGALVLILCCFAAYCTYHRRSYRKNQQHLTEELQTVENGYHDNPTLEVMEIQPEMQEKKLTLNGEFNDSWIVPIDNLLKEDIPDEEDTHL